jgi:hypothetical protein
MTFLATLYILVMNFLNSIARSNKIVFYSTILFMILLFGGIYNCADNEAYQALFDYARAHGFHVYASTEVGFSFLVFIVGKFGLSYKIFRTLIPLIGLFLIQKTVFDFTKKYSLVFLLYFVYPFMLDVIQIQNFLAGSIVVYSIRFLTLDIKNGDLKYFIGILIAVSIHYMAVFFLPFVFIKKYSIRELVRVILIFVPVICIITSTQLIPNLVRRIVGDEMMYNLNSYFQRAHWGFILLWGRQLAGFALVYLSYLIVKNEDELDEWNKFNEIIVKLNLYLIIICFPLVMFNGNFLRLYRIILILNYVVISQVYYLNTRKGTVFILLTLAVITLYFGLDILTSSNINSVLIPFFLSNSFLWFPS